MTRKVQPDEVRKFLEELENFLNVHGYNKGVKFKRKRIKRLGDTNWEYVLHVTAQKHNTYTSMEEEDYKKFSQQHKIEAPIGTIFTHKSKRYKISGYSRKARVYPFLATSLSNGKCYKFSIKLLKRCLDNQGLNHS